MDQCLQNGRYIKQHGSGHSYLHTRPGWTCTEGTLRWIGSVNVRGNIHSLHLRRRRKSIGWPLGTYQRCICTLPGRDKHKQLNGPVHSTRLWASERCLVVGITGDIYHLTPTVGRHLYWRINLVWLLKYRSQCIFKLVCKLKFYFNNWRFYPNISQLANTQAGSKLVSKSCHQYVISNVNWINSALTAMRIAYCIIALLKSAW